MNYSEWRELIFSDFSLQVDIDRFRDSDDQVRYIDRHIIDRFKNIPQLDDYDGYWAVCKVGIEILDRWIEFIESLADNSILVSLPYFIIDDEWLNKEINSAPPHIFTTLAKHTKFWQPTFINNKVSARPAYDSKLGQLIVGTGLTTIRTEALPDDTDRSGSWILLWR